VPAGRDADERLVDLLGGQPHRVEVGPMGGALRPLRYVTARQPLLDVGLGVHPQNLFPQPSPGRSREQFPVAFTGAEANQQCKKWFHGGVWLKSGASKRQPERLTKCSSTVAVTQQSLPGGNPYLGLSKLPRSDRPPYRRPHPGPSQPEGDQWTSFSNARFAARHRATKLNLAISPRTAENHKRNSSD